MKTKICFKCKIEKPLSDFYEHSQMGDGHLGKCKDCAKQDAALNRINNPRVREYDRERAKNPERKKANMENLRKRRREDPRKMRAYNNVKRTVRSGKILKLKCIVCGNEQVQGHHEDYDKPLDVIWLCQKHHDARHLELGWG